ncbi:GNAT family protein [Nonomuraea fuscirosea]|uniref:GNAT family N-acetyltransferase n=1 Tax=Nonomuraea fuscirosea TaxID=1291556 RepID=UPI00342A6820
MLVGDVVRLRPFEPEEARAIWRWQSDPEVTQWLSDDYPESLAYRMARVAGWKPNSYEDVRLGIERPADGRLIGLARLRGAEPQTGHAEFGLYIGEKDCQGRGYGTEAARLMCSYGFARMRLHRITLWVVEANVSAIHCYKKVGFVEEGRAREAFRDREGHWHDKVLMGLLERDLRS